jgi:AraC-like DNA-binding protein
MLSENVSANVVSMHDAAQLAQVARLCGLDIDFLLASAGIEVSSASNAVMCLSMDALAKLYRTGNARAHRPFPFVLGENYKFDNLPEIKAFLSCVSSIEDMLWLLDFVPCLIHPDMATRYEFRRKRCHIFLELKTTATPERELAGLVETLFVVLQQQFRTITNKRIEMEFLFKHQPLVDLFYYEQQFGYQMAFNAQENSLIIAEEHVRYRGHVVSTVLQAQTHLLAEKRLREIQRAHGITVAASTVLRQKPDISISDLAISLGIQSRTLQRKFRDENTSFNQLQRHAKLNLSKEMLTDLHLDIDIIALKLGYSDRKSFSKAFTKWQGMAPSQFRRSCYRQCQGL